MEIKLKENTFKLCVQKAIFWQEKHTLLISDLHIGKILHFRKAGIAIPQKAVTDNFTRLDQLMDTHEVKKVLFIGDLFHSDVNKEWDAFCTWRKHYPSVEMDIVLGNHDRLPSSFCDDFQMNIHQQDLEIEGFTFSHHPKKEFSSEDQYVFSGHVHPVMELRGKANQYVKLPCFYFGLQQAILPSFGYFTGGYAIKPTEEDRVVVIAEEKLIPLAPIL